VQIAGNARIPTATILHYVSAAPDKVYDEAQARSDLRRLYELGVFQTLDVLTQDAGEGRVDVIYQVREQPFVSDFVIEGTGLGEEDQIHRLLEKEKLLVKPATPFRPGTVNKAADLVRTYLHAHKYPFAEVHVLTEDGKGNTARVLLSIHPGPHLDIGEVRFSGNYSIPSAELLKQLQHSRPAPFYAWWTSQGAYAPEIVVADLETLRHYYQSRGFAAVSIGQPQLLARNFTGHWWMPIPKMSGSRQRLVLSIPITEGPRFKLVSAECEGDAKFAAAEVAKILATVKSPSEYDYSRLEAARQKMADALGHAGYALAEVQLEQTIDSNTCTVRALYRISADNPVAIGEIRFEGNTRVRDKFLRREIVPREGEVFDLAKLDQSIRRLNRSGMIKEVQRSDVHLEMNEKTDALDITFKVQEKDRQGIYGTGGTGGVGGGYLGVIYSAFDLLGLGESLALHMDGGASQSNLILDIVGDHFLGLPFTLGLSVFDRFTNFNVANVVPNASTLLGVLKLRTAGVGLSGAYPVTSKVRVGLGTQFERLSATGDTAAESASEYNSIQRRTDLTPSFVFDSTTGTGPATRGARFSAANSWSGTTFLRTIDTTSQAFRFSQYTGDPFTNGRNSFAFHLQAAVTRPQNGIPLTLDRRFFPGDEILRGFRRGSLSPWGYDPNSQPSTVPVGADTVLGFSAEYRVPIRGPLSATAFVDLGWSSVSQKNVDLGTTTTLIDGTNRLLRASVGTEFRLDLPFIHQPGRLIFSYNPLRLDKIFQNGGSPLRLADPRGTIHFALGDIF
jgi:outer membrane protein assembly complex protein YaeT